MELPTVNSTTSISDNDELRKYYDKFLFKSNNPSSSTNLLEKRSDQSDHQQPQDTALDVAPNSGDLKSGLRPEVDFIKGFSGHSPLSNETISSRRESLTTKPSFSIFQNSERTDKQPPSVVDPASRLFTGFKSTFLGDPTMTNDGSQMGQPASQPAPRRQSIFDIATPAPESSTAPDDNNLFINPEPSSLSHDLLNSVAPPILHQDVNNLAINFATARRSSYISDTLIHSHLVANQYISKTNMFRTKNQSTILPEEGNGSSGGGDVHFPSLHENHPFSVNEGRKYSTVSPIQTAPFYTGSINADTSLNGTTTSTGTGPYKLHQNGAPFSSSSNAVNLTYDNASTSYQVLPQQQQQQPQQQHRQSYNFNQFYDYQFQPQLQSTAANQGPLQVAPDKRIQQDKYGYMNFANGQIMHSNRKSVSPASFDKGGNGSGSGSADGITKNINGSRVQSSPTSGNYYRYYNNSQNKSNGPGVNGIGNNSNKGPYEKLSNGNNSSSNNTNNSSASNGLVLTEDKKLSSSEDLQKIYTECGSNYFSSAQVYEFTDYIKSMIQDKADADASAADSSVRASVLKFLKFLRCCNMNYTESSTDSLSPSPTPVANATTTLAPKSKEKGSKTPTNDRRPSTNHITSSGQPGKSGFGNSGAQVTYRPLILVALKNGKLELLSVPQNTNLSMKRGDLVIIDGDRGKDLSLVVEPVVDLNMALIINFLKKKIHFDSLITNRSQHCPNEKFISALVNSTNNMKDELNPKLYDVVELTQLIVPSKQVLRFATPWEVSTNLHNKFQEELKALHVARLKLKVLNSGISGNSGGNSNVESVGEQGKASNSQSSTRTSTPTSVSSTTTPPPPQQQRQQLNIKILNAEFQFDRKKLTFYYLCKERNDFRELIKELFKFYKTRIWLCAIPNNLEIDTKYYDKGQKELKMYQEMMQHLSAEELNDNSSAINGPPGAGGNGSGYQQTYSVAPPLNKLELDNFQIGVYRELVRELF